MARLLRWGWRGAIVAAAVIATAAHTQATTATTMRRMLQQGSDGAAALAAGPVPMVASVQAAAAAAPIVPASQPAGTDPRLPIPVLSATPTDAAAAAEASEEEDEEGESEATDGEEEAEAEEEATQTPATDATAAPLPIVPPTPVEAIPQQPRATQRRSKPAPAVPAARTAPTQQLDDAPTSEPTQARQQVQPAEAISSPNPVPMVASIAAVPGGASERNSNSESAQQTQQPQQPQQQAPEPSEPAPRAADSAAAEKARKLRVRRATERAAAAAGGDVAARDELPAGKPELNRQNAVASRKRGQHTGSKSRPRPDEEPQNIELRSPQEQQQQQRPPQQQPKTRKRQRASPTPTTPLVDSPAVAAAAPMSASAKLPDDVVGPEDRENVEAGEANGEAAARPKEHVAASPSIYDALADRQPEQASALGAAKHALGGSDPDEQEESQPEAVPSRASSPADAESPAAPLKPTASALPPSLRDSSNQAQKRISERFKSPSQRKRPTRPTASASAPLGRDEVLPSDQEQRQPTPPLKPVDPALAFQAAKDRAAELADLHGVPTTPPLKRPVPPAFRDSEAGSEAVAAPASSKTVSEVTTDDPLLTPRTPVVDAPPTAAGAVDSAREVPKPAGATPSLEVDSAPASSPPLTIETALAEPPLVLHDLKLQDASNLTNAYLSRVNPPATKEPVSSQGASDATPAVPAPAASTDAVPASESPVVSPPAAAPEVTTVPEVRESRTQPKEDHSTPSASLVDTPAPAVSVTPAAADAAAPAVPARTAVPDAVVPSANPIVDSTDSPLTPASPSLVDSSPALPEPEWRKVDRAPVGGSSSTGFVLLFAFVSFCVFMMLKLKRMIAGEEAATEHEGETGGLLSASSSGAQASSSPRARPVIKPGQVVLDSLTDEEDPEMGFALRHNGAAQHPSSSQQQQAAESAAPTSSIRGMSLKSTGRQAARPTSLKKGKLGLGAKQIDNESD